MPNFGRIIESFDRLEESLGKAERRVLIDSKMHLQGGIPMEEADREMWKSKNLSLQQRVAELKSQVSFIKKRYEMKMMKIKGDLLEFEAVSGGSQRDRDCQMLSTDSAYFDATQSYNDLDALSEYLSDILWAMKIGLQKIK